MNQCKMNLNNKNLAGLTDDLHFNPSLNVRHAVCGSVKACVKFAQLAQILDLWPECLSTSIPEEPNEY